MAAPTPTIDDLDGLLSSLNQLKPPGASKTKITTITALCVNNIKVESNIVQSFYRALKKAPATHKLGALYVIDSVVRQWIEKAKAAGQDLHIEGRGEPGTYPAAVKRVTELMPALFDDMLKVIPAEQKPKLENMITIWERGNTFPAKMLAEFKSRLSGDSTQSAPAAPTNGAVTAPSTAQVAPKPTRPIGTPVGYPPRYMYEQGLAAPLQANGAPAQVPKATPPTQPVQNAPSADVNSILAALSKAAPPPPKPAYTAPAPVSAPAPAAPPAAAQLPPEIAALFAQQAAAPTPAQQFQQQAPPYGYSQPPASANSAYPGAPPFGFPPQPPSIPQSYAAAPPPPQQTFLPPSQSDPLAQLRGLLPENILNDTQKLIPALQLLQDLQKNGIPPEQWAPVLKGFEEQFQPAQPAGFTAQPTFGGRPQGRSRSRSPDRGGARGGRGSPVYGSYDANAARRQPEEDRNGRGQNGRSRYRQRSPLRDNPSAVAMNGKPMQPKNITYDPSLPNGHIKVLSRTLFVGGANGTQQEIQELFERFGSVQTCISNRDKRHAFVKMTTRQFALNAKSSMEELQSRNDRDVMNIARQTKWGVGFGPRECCDYAKGESVIPIGKLTDADTKWLLTAEYGGTGGRPIEGGMVLEEPDIEIGAGVSSKAMSKRVGPDSGHHAGKRNREERGGRHGGGHGKHKGGDHGYGGGFSGFSSANTAPLAGQQAVDPYAYARPEPVAVATPPAVPGFGFSILPQGNGGGSNYR